MSESKSNQNAAASSNIRQPRRHMAQNYLLIWVDATIDQTNKDCQYTLAQLKSVANDVNLFTESDQCIQALNKVDKQQAFVITSGYLGQHLVPKIHDMPQLDAIYIFCGDKSRHQGWTQNWTKIKGVHTDIKDICQALQSAVKQSDQDAIAVSFLTINEMSSTENLNQLEPTFMYTQLFKEILLDMEYGDNAIKDLVILCRELYPNNKGELKIINEFERDYDPEKAIWWYTRECFTYKMLNKALRIMDADIIITMGFFLRDVHQQIQQLHEQQVSTYDEKSFKVYRGQGLMKSDFEKLQKAEGGLMSFNNFLSTSTNEKVSFSFAQDASTKPNMVGILFIMSIDPCLKASPFASIQEVSYFKGEEETLFSMHTVFRVKAIKQIGNKTQVYQVELELTSDDDQQLRLLTDRIRKETSGSTGWKRLGNLLIKIGQFNKAEELYNVLLEQTSDEAEKQHYYNQLGCVKVEQGDYEKAISYHKRRLEIQQKTLPSDHPDLATSYNNIGLVYHKMGEYLEALSFYEKDLEICQKNLPPDHLDLAASYSNIGSVYDSMGEYSKALSFYEKSLEIQQKTLPSNHPGLAASYNNIGDVHRQMGNFSKALSFYEKGFEIRQKTLPSDHTDLASSYNNIGFVSENMGEYSKALSSHEKTVEICQKTLSSDHPHLAFSYNNIGRVHVKMGEYSKALSFHEKALAIQQKTISSNHPDFAQSCGSIGFVYYSMKDYSQALSYYKRALDIWQRTLPPTHPCIKSAKETIEMLKRKL
ncbi:unnamed protein product [Adineta steineri]|uniref:NAD(P)(+)--arginine ADP-ribosyltransferase n=2 Tax=Adineta steineri TaxID=433720 RepID=A0A814IHS7_9BILA|nr:unnamed protein product [Adineta steineri]CAF4035488.1 unnamed protein product [Adineta steineri]CAF4079688.1 unnamed protein product [Adineta steineri]